MNSKLTYRQYFWIILIPLLVGCRLGTTTAIPTQAVNMTATFEKTASTASIEMTQTATIVPTDLPTETPGPTPTGTLLPSFTLDGLRVAYVIDGNIYVQDSGGQPVQLTYSGEDRNPTFSGDGEKIVFFRGPLKEQHRLYTINADGSQEQALITGSILTSLGLGYNESTELDNLVFVPGTHQMLFDTQEFEITGDEERDRQHFGGNKNLDLLIVNIDTMEFARLQDPGKAGLFRVSPNGKLVTDSYNVFGINGDIVHSNLITHLPAWEGEGIFLFWTQDSSKVIILPPIKGNADPMDGPEPRTIWQYPIDGSPAFEVRLYPAPMAHYFTLSPDGNWIAYSYFHYTGKTDDAFPNGVYLGNLRDGSLRVLGSSSYGAPSSYYWSLDNQYFIFYDDNHSPSLYLGNTHGDITPLGSGRFIGWIDNKRYISYTRGGIAMRTVNEEKSVLILDLPEDFRYSYDAPLIYVFVNPDLKK